MSEPSLFRHYQIVQDAEGNNVELVRSADQVAVLAFDNDRLEFVHCHVLLEPLKHKADFDEACRTLQQSGHPLLAAMIDFGEDDGNPFYITSNVDGESLRSYLQRQTEIPLWLGAMVATRALDAAIVLGERGDYLTEQPLDSLRLVQTGASAVQVQVADFRVLESAAKGKSRLIKANFDRQAKFLRTFLKEQGGGGGPTLPDMMLSAVDFAELISSTLASGGPGLTGAMTELRNALVKMVPEHLAGEIPTAQKPRALVAPLLATYQEVARGVVNLVRIQSQRLDMANPYSMRGTLTRTGRSVLVEQVPPLRLCGKRVSDLDKTVQKLAKKRDVTALLPVPLINETEGLTCLAEDVVDGISLADILRERGCLTVPEAYVVLAGADAALSQLERASLPTRKLRLEDIFLLTGFGREDPRTARLLSTRLNEWPSFTVMLRVHPTLASMSGRGTNPAMLLPPPMQGVASIWHGGWMAALGKFLMGVENGVSSGTNERESIAKLFDDEILKSRAGGAASRSDLIARFARVIQHYDLVAGTPIPTAAPENARLKPTVRKTATETSVVASAPVVVESPRAIAAAPSLASPIASNMIPAGLPIGTGEGTGESIGFAELLFAGSASEGGAKTQAEVWGQGASEDFSSGEVGGWGTDQDDTSPWWLKASVFLGGSMVVGAFLAQLSGHALWQKHPISPPLKAQSALERPFSADS